MLERKNSKVIIKNILNIIKLFLFISIWLQIVGCASNLPVRSAKTLPKGVSYHHVNVNKVKLEFNAQTSDTTDSTLNFTDQFLFSYSYRRGLTNWLELELGGGIITPSILGINAGIKLPLIPSSVGTGAPGFSKGHRFGLLGGCGGYLMASGAMSSFNKWAIVPGLYLSYDLINLQKHFFDVIISSGIEYFFTNKTYNYYNEIYNEIDSTTTTINHDFYSDLYGLQFPLGLSLSFERLNFGFNFRFKVPLEDNQSFDSDTQINSKVLNMDFSESYVWTLSLGYSFNWKDKVPDTQRQKLKNESWRGLFFQTVPGFGVGYAITGNWKPYGIRNLILEASPVTLAIISLMFYPNKSINLSEKQENAFIAADIVCGVLYAAAKLFSISELSVLELKKMKK